MSRGEVWFFRAVAVPPARFSGPTGFRRWTNGEIDWYLYRLRDRQMAWNRAGVSLTGPGRAEVHDLILPSWFVLLATLILPGVWLARRYRRAATTPRRLLDHRMADGSRNFAEVPWRPPFALKQRLSKLPGVTVTAFIGDVTETWIDFDYAGHSFTVQNPLMNDFWLIVRDPACPDELLNRVVAFLK